MNEMSKRWLCQLPCICLMMSLAGVSRAAEPVPSEPAKLIESVRLTQGARVVQGMALTPEFYYSSDNRGGVGLINRFDTKWKLVETKELRVEGVNHIGAISYHDGYIWAGWLTGGKDAKRRSIVTQISAKDLTIHRKWEITADVTWIDPVTFDGKHVWVGDMSDLGIHRYRIEGDRLVRDGILRYPRAMSFSQGLRIVGDRLYSIHTFGTMDGLFEFRLPKASFDGKQTNQPRRVWPVAETKMHLEGFDFIPGQADQIFHCQGSQVDRWRLVNVNN